MLPDWLKFHTHILELEQKGLVTRTFRRLDPQRQQAIVHAILEESAEKGPASLNIKEVARRADVSIGSLYQYFCSRNGLLDFAVELCVRYVTDMFRAYQPYLASLPLKEALHVYVMGGLEWGRTEEGLVRFFGRAAYQGDPALSERVVRPVASIMREMVQSILEQAVQRGEIRPDIDLQATARVINTLMIAVADSQLFPYLNAYFQLTGESMPLERIVEAAFSLLLNGISPCPQP